MDGPGVFRMYSERIGEGHGAISLMTLLGLKRLGLIYLHKGELEPVEDQAHPGHEGAYERLFVHAVAVPKGVAVQGHISKYALSVHPHEGMDPPPAEQWKEPGILLIHGRVGIGARSDQARTEIIGEIPSEADLRPDVGADVQVSQTGAQIGYKIITPSSARGRLKHLIPVFKKKIQNRLIPDLMVPPLRNLIPFPTMNRLLNIFGIGVPAGHPQHDFPGVHVTAGCNSTPLWRLRKVPCAISAYR